MPELGRELCCKKTLLGTRRKAPASRRGEQIVQTTSEFWFQTILMLPNAARAADKFGSGENVG
jgi:hypothetical protein